MAEDGLSLRRNKKIAGVEDSVVVLQRILNIFRQLHILNQAQKDDFNSMILRQPPEIRHMCHVLPGGSLLQEYVDELEESLGIAPDQKIEDDATAIPATGNILADALSNKQAKPAPTSTVSDSATNNEDFQKQMLLMMQAMKSSTAAVPSAGGTLTTDANFAKEIASALSMALETSDEKRRKETQELTKNLTESQLQMTKILVSQIIKNTPRSAEGSLEAPVQIKQVVTPSLAAENTDNVQTVKVIDNTQEITKAITESQLQMAKMFLQQNAINAANISSNNAANNIQINNAMTPASGGQQLIGDIIKAQSQLFQEISRTQTKELALLISDALKESSKLSNKSLIEALSAFQKENLKFLEKQAQNQNSKVVYYQAPTEAAHEDKAPAPMPVYAPAPEVDYEATAPSYIKKVLGNVFSRGKSEDAPVPTEEETFFNETDYNQDQMETAVEEVNFDNNSEDSNDEGDFEIANDGLGLSGSAEIKKKKKKKKKNKNKNNLLFDETNPQNGYVPIYAESKTNFEEITQGSDENIEIEDFNFNLDMNQTAEETDNFGLDSSLFDLDIPLEQTATSSVEKENDFAMLDISIFEDIAPTAPEQIASEEAFFEYQEEPTEEINIEQEEEVIEQIEPETLAEKEEHSPQSLLRNLKNLSGLSEKFGSPTEFKEDEALSLDADYKIAVEAPAFEDNEESDDSNWEWEYEEAQATSAPIEAVAVEDASDSPSEEEGEWEWEYEEAQATSAPIEAVAVEDAPGSPSEEEGEWEWEYDEAETTATPIEAVAVEDAPDSPSEEEGEWEWEYEEAETTSAPIEAVAVEDASDSPSEEEGEWEWEYEEAETTATPIEAVAVEDAPDSPSEEEGEWEWEYEEAETTSAPIEAAAVEDASDALSEEEGEWEWEYEEASQEQNINAKIKNMDDNDLSSLFDKFNQENETPLSDPYAGKHENEDDLGLASLQSGSLFFQKDISVSSNQEKIPLPNLDNLEPEVVFAEFGEEDSKNEPYHLGSTPIKL